MQPAKPARHPFPLCRLCRALLVLLVLACLAPINNVAQESSLTAIETMIPMRDGVRLYTQIYAPKDVGADRRVRPGADLSTARPEPFDSTLTLSLSKGERLAQDRPAEGR